MVRSERTTRRFYESRRCHSFVTICHELPAEQSSERVAAIRSCARCRCSFHPSTRTSVSDSGVLRLGGGTAEAQRPDRGLALRRRAPAGSARSSWATGRAARRGRPADAACCPRRRRPYAPAGRDPRGPRHAGPRLARREARGVRRARARRSDRDRARCQGRGRAGRVQLELGSVSRRGSARRTTSTRGARPHGSSTRSGLYLIGRVVVFEDPILSQARPDLAVRRRDGSVWQDSAGLGWTNPYDQRVWDYNIAVAAAAARKGLTRSCSTTSASPPTATWRTRSTAVSATLTKRRRAGVLELRLPAARAARRRVSAALFGLSAARDMGIGQIPRRIPPSTSTRSIDDLSVAFRRRRARARRTPARRPARPSRARSSASTGRSKAEVALLVPWVQDFSFTAPYGKDEVRAQIYAARIAGARAICSGTPRASTRPGRSPRRSAAGPTDDPRTPARRRG